ncbi:MAG TPA: hypothetical protein VGC61_04150 [Pyrinomonadaceae bacterium]|jgi:hypothetical protein
MLHIHNGDCSADTARKASLPGEHLAWRESLITGPTPAGVPQDEWLKLRARHLSEGFRADLQACERDLLRQEEVLRTFARHDEVVLWFEHDLFCQLHLIYLLNWFATEHATAKTRLSLICIDEFPGKENFRGLGELSCAELASLFPGRSEVTETQLRVAGSAWGAYSSPDPTAIEKLLDADTSSLPFLDAALRAHLQRFPATTNGLGRVESSALGLVRQGHGSFVDVFAKFGATEPVYGFGDAQLWLVLRRLSSTNQPLLKIAGTEDSAESETLTPEIARGARLALTDLGESVLDGEADFVTLNGIDLWLGGAYLHGGEGLWRWNEQSRRLEFAQN